MGLHEHGVDLFEVNGFGAVAHGFDEGTGTEVSNGPQNALGDAQDEVEGVVVKSRFTSSRFPELSS
jgi:hypothetical protein